MTPRRRHAVTTPSHPALTIATGDSHTQPLRQRLLRILRQHGNHALAYSTLQGGMTYFEDGSREGYIAYKHVRKFLTDHILVLGRPICCDDRLKAILLAFLLHARRGFRRARVSFWQIDTMTLAALSAIQTEFGNDFSFVSHPAGEVVSFSLQNLDLKGNHWEFLRVAQNRCRSSGLHISEVRENGAFRDSLDFVSRSWISRISLHRRELSFLTRPATWSLD